MSDYTEAMDLTIHTINKRAANHRNMVIGTCCIFILALITTIAIQSINYVSLLSILIPLSGVFFYRDWAIVQSWRSEILDNWASGNIELGIFKSTLLQLPHLPDETTNSMLSTLPDCGDTTGEIQIKSVNRSFISTLAVFINATRGELIVLRSAYASVAVGLLVLSLYSRSWVPAIACLMVFTYPIVKGMWIRSRGRHTKFALVNLLDSDQIEKAQLNECLMRYDLAPYQSVNLTPFALTFKS